MFLLIAISEESSETKFFFNLLIYNTTKNMNL